MRLVPYRSVEPLCRLTGSARSRVVSNGVGLGVGGPNCGWTPDGHCCEPRPRSGSAEVLPPHGGRHFSAIQQIRLIAVVLCVWPAANPPGPVWVLSGARARTLGFRRQPQNRRFWPIRQRQVRAPLASESGGISHPPISLSLPPSQRNQCMLCAGGGSLSVSAEVTGRGRGRVG